jgi:AcrR family transcriptional regulator
MSVMAKTRGGARARRQPLSRERVLQAALRLADRDGVASLSMRGLAQTLGVEAMSLYKHVANKDEVLDGLIDLVVAEIDVPPPGTAWRHAMRQRAMSARRVFLRHPWAALLMESRLSQSAARLRYADAVLGLLRGDGFPVPLAYRTFVIIDSYLYGYVMQEVHWPIEAAEMSQVEQELTAQLSTADYPHLMEAMTHVMATRAEHRVAGVYDVDFAAGLELILDAIERLRASQAAPPRPEGPRRGLADTCD